MIFIKKQDTPPQRFIDATQGLPNYEALQGDNRTIVTDLLLKEQVGFVLFVNGRKTNSHLQSNIFYLKVFSLIYN